MASRKKSATVTEKPTRASFLGRWRWVFVAGGIAATLLLVGLVIYSLLRHHADLTNVDVVKQKVAHHLLLPKNEQPALATITDKTKVHSQFLQKAENGDKVLIYQDAKKVIIYRPSVDKIVDVGPIEIAPAPRQPTQ